MKVVHSQHGAIDESMRHFSSASRLIQKAMNNNEVQSIANARTEEVASALTAELLRPFFEQIVEDYFNSTSFSQDDSSCVLSKHLYIDVMSRYIGDIPEIKEAIKEAITTNTPIERVYNIQHSELQSGQVYNIVI